ncbi:Pentatricopeptide repeat-containing protein [Vitis vinifera]|uniref:Pentatricopeptide repeat-containing protein n=1 Tax=Vitis vinifera TaxID=29760 RepID=A0A438F3E2_VITVI|nr:Pentatricopeptide repeat-containing protein [Vitis vinifera]
MGLCMRVFDEMPHRDVVSWTVLITGYRSAERYDDALIAFEQMQYAGLVPNHVTMVNALSACADFGALENGASSSKKWGGGSLVVFIRMEQEGIKADEVTLIAVLCACSHSGMVQMGRQIFGSLMNGKYGFSPGVKHYACVIDLLARAGILQEAMGVMTRMPFEPNKVMWGAFLAGCRAHGDLELSEFAARKLVELEPGNGAYYVLLSNIYAEMGRWSDVEKVRRLMKEGGLTKDLGCSSIELESQERVYELLAE